MAALGDCRQIETWNWRRAWTLLSRNLGHADALPQLHTCNAFPSALWHRLSEKVTIRGGEEGGSIALRDLEKCQGKNTQDGKVTCKASRKLLTLLSSKSHHSMPAVRVTGKMTIGVKTTVRRSTTYLRKEACPDESPCAGGQMRVSKGGPSLQVPPAKVSAISRSRARRPATARAGTRREIE